MCLIYLVNTSQDRYEFTMHLTRFTGTPKPLLEARKAFGFYEDGQQSVVDHSLLSSRMMLSIVSNQRVGLYDTESPHVLLSLSSNTSFCFFRWKGNTLFDNPGQLLANVSSFFILLKWPEHSTDTSYKTSTYRHWSYHIISVGPSSLVPQNHRCSCFFFFWWGNRVTAI